MGNRKGKRERGNKRERGGKRCGIKRENEKSDREQRTEGEIKDGK